MSTGQLSDVELTCLEHLAHGRSMSDLQALLALTDVATETVLDGLEKKLGAQNRLHAVIIAMRLGLIVEAQA